MLKGSPLNLSRAIFFKFQDVWETVPAKKNNRASGKAMSISKGGFTHTPWVVIGAPVEGNLYQVVLDDLGVADKAEPVVPGYSASIYKNSKGNHGMGGGRREDHN